MKWVRDDSAVRVRLEKTHKRGEGSGVMKNGREDQAGRKTNGEIVVGRKHWWLSKGEDVFAAGEINFGNNGRITNINNASGHYLPNPDHAFNFIRIFKRQGVNMDQTALTILSEDGSTFRQILSSYPNRVLYE